MNLVSILLIATAFLALMTGLVSLVGASRADRGRMAWFFVATIGIATWSLAIAAFLGMPDTTDPVKAEIFIYGIYLSALVAVPALLGYSAWKYLAGKFLTIFYILVGCILGAILIHDPSVLYSELIMDRMAGNSITIVHGWFYLVYFIYFLTCFSAYLAILFYRVRHTKNKRVRTGDALLLGGMVVSSGFTGLFDLILPYFGNYASIWVGPFVITVVMVVFFYSVIKYRIISVEARWMKTLSLIVVMTVGVIVYMLLFYTIFTALFKVANPTPAVLVLNFLMIVILLLLMPVINELSSSIKSLISVGQVDIAYVIKKLNRLASKKIDLYELASFLAEHLHFAYVGFIVNGHLYGSKTLSLSRDEIDQIAKMKTTSRNGMWQVPTKSVQKILDETNLKAVAELYNAKGKPFGQIIVGKPLGKSAMEHRDLIQLEMIINLVASVIDSGKHLRA